MNKIEMIRRIKLELSGVKKTKMEEGEGLEGSCWEGYIAIGTKVTEDGRTVPNCVPDPEQMKKIKKEGFPIPSPNSGDNENDYIARCISEISGEYDAEGQAYAVCKKSWDEK